MDDKTIRREVRDLISEGEGRVQATLIVMAGRDIGKTYPIEGHTVYIGRHEDCEIHIDDEEISRRHAKVTLKGFDLYIMDLGSTNGTLLNGEKLEPNVEKPLSNGDKIQLGSNTVLKLDYQDDLETIFSEQLYNSANKDFLTQTYNKKFFLDRLRTEFSFSRRHGLPLSLIVFDIDHFKQINDEYGHAAGDMVLKEMCRRIGDKKREEDLFARYGGEEFVLLLRDTDTETAVQIAQAMRNLIKEKEFEFEDKKIPVTISCGIATLLNDNFKNYEELFRKADAYLYEAKRAGRDAVRSSLDEKQE